LSHVSYIIIEHDGGWAYRVGGHHFRDVPYPRGAHKAAVAAAAEQRAPGETTSIEYETPDSQWREERARGDDRPEYRREGLVVVEQARRLRRSGPGRPIPGV